MNDQLATSYRACHEIVRRSNSNFALAFWLLPRPQRQAMDALYAFARHTDDLGDSGTASVDERFESLRAWRSELHAALARRTTPQPILAAVADTVERFQIPPQLLEDIINGVERDLTQSRYQTWEELQGYCYQVAGAVGLACIYIWGTRNEPPRQLAEACGQAFQLTNILRDLAEDARRDRIYLPQEELAQFGYREQDLQHGIANEAFDRLIAFQLARADALYDQAAGLHHHLTRDGQRVFRLMFGRYRAILTAIGQNPRQVLHRRVSLSLPHKLWIAGRKLLASQP